MERTRTQSALHTIHLSIIHCTVYSTVDTVCMEMLEINMKLFILVFFVVAAFFLVLYELAFPPKRSIHIKYVVLTLNHIIIEIE